MKPAYKLLGVVWDGLPLPDVLPEVGLADGEVLLAGTPPNLFDLDLCRRAVPLSVLFSSETSEGLAAYLTALSNCDEVHVVVDWWPLVSGKVAREFFDRRVMQAFRFVQDALPDKDVKLAQNEAPEPTRMPKSIDNLFKFMQVIEYFTLYLRDQGMTFNEEGFPMLGRECFLESWPEVVVDYYHRKGKLVDDPSRTLLCEFSNDLFNYRRIAKVFDELAEYRRFMGVVAADVTVTVDMDIEWQAATMLVNQLFMAVLAVNGIKVVANSRCGSIKTAKYLHSVPSGVKWASSFLGCNVTSDPTDTTYVGKALQLRSSNIILYGKLDKEVRIQLNRMGIDARHYADVHAAYKNGK